MWTILRGRGGSKVEAVRYANVSLSHIFQKYDANNFFYDFA
jgi:hypothetical protein